MFIMSSGKLGTFDIDSSVSWNILWLTTRSFTLIALVKKPRLMNSVTFSPNLTGYFVNQDLFVCFEPDITPLVR